MSDNSHEIKIDQLASMAKEPVLNLANNIGAIVRAGGLYDFDAHKMRDGSFPDAALPLFFKSEMAYISGYVAIRKSRKAAVFAACSLSKLYAGLGGLVDERAVRSDFWVLPCGGDVVQAVKSSDGEVGVYGRMHDARAVYIDERTQDGVLRAATSVCYEREEPRFSPDVTVGFIAGWGTDGMYAACWPAVPPGFRADYDTEFRMHGFAALHEGKVLATSQRLSVLHSMVEDELGSEALRTSYEVRPCDREIQDGGRGVPHRIVRGMACGFRKKVGLKLVEGD